MSPAIARWKIVQCVSQEILQLTATYYQILYEVWHFQRILRIAEAIEAERERIRMEAVQLKLQS